MMIGSIRTQTSNYQFHVYRRDLVSISLFEMEIMVIKYKAMPRHCHLITSNKKPLINVNKKVLFMNIYDDGQ